MALFLIGVLVLLALAAPFVGTDSRDGRDWQPRGDWEARQAHLDAQLRATARSHVAGDQQPAGRSSRTAGPVARPRQAH